MIERVEWGLDARAWQAHADRCPEATFFHTPGWYHARGRGMRLVTPKFTFGDGSWAIVPLAVRSRFRGLTREAVSGLENGYGGVLAPTPLSPGQTEAIHRVLARRFTDLTLVGNPHAEGLAPGGIATDATQALDVVAPAEQLARMAGMRARHLKKAAKAGFRLELRQGLRASDAEAVYDVYARHAASWQYTRWVRDRAYFEGLFAEAGKHLALFSAYSGDTLAGFHLLGCQGRVAIQLHLATDAEFDRSNVGTLLIAEALAWCHTSGHDTFDFLPSGELEGIRAFKASFGAELRPFTTVRRQGLAAGALERLWRLRHGKPAV